MVWLHPEERWGFGLAEGFHRSYWKQGKGDLISCFLPRPWKEIFFQGQPFDSRLGHTRLHGQALLRAPLTDRGVLSSPLAGCSVLSSLAGSKSNITCSCREAPYVRSSLFDNFELMSDLKLFSDCNYYNENTKEIDFLYSSHYIALDFCLSAEGLNMIHVIYFPTNHLFNYLLELRQERPKKERGETDLECTFNKMLQTTTNH